MKQNTTGLAFRTGSPATRILVEEGGLEFCQLGPEKYLDAAELLKEEYDRYYGQAMASVFQSAYFYKGFIRDHQNLILIGVLRQGKLGAVALLLKTWQTGQMLPSSIYRDTFNVEATAREYNLDYIWISGRHSVSTSALFKRKERAAIFDFFARSAVRIVLMHQNSAVLSILNDALLRYHAVHGFPWRVLATVADPMEGSLRLRACILLDSEAPERYLPD